MDTNEPLTETNDSRRTVSPDSSAAPSKPPLYIGSEHEYVYSIFRDGAASVSKMVLIATVLQLLLIPIICIMPYPWGITIDMIYGHHAAHSLEKALEGFSNLWVPLALTSPISFLAILAIPYVPGILVRRAFARIVIPMCKNTCPGKEIACGAMRSLRHMLVRYVLALLPGIIVYLVPVVLTLGILINIGCENDPGEPLRIQASFSVIVWMYILSLPGYLLSEYALAIFPVARLFTRLSGAIRPGMFLMLPLIYLARFVLVLNPVFTAERPIFLTVAILVACTALSVGAIAYFNYAARTGAEKWGLRDRG